MPAQASLMRNTFFTAKANATSTANSSILPNQGHAMQLCNSELTQKSPPPICDSMSIVNTWVVRNGVSAAVSSKK